MSQHKGILLVNLGSPDSPNAKDVKPYLEEFLMDERVIDAPFWLRSILVRGIILNTRPKKSAEAYQKIWWDSGSPLIVISKRLQAKVQQFSKYPIGLGMRYGNPSIESGIRNLLQEYPELDEILLIPLYPHYAMSSYETVVVKARQVMESTFPQLKLSIQEAFYHDPRYIEILADTFKPAVEAGFDHLLFSYHGVPERHIRKGDITKSHCLNYRDCCLKDSPAHQFCYRHQTQLSTDLVAKELGLKDGQYSTSYQSRLGRDPWLTPFTDHTIIDLAKKGVKKLVVACPAFVSDCLETIEEIGMEGKELFLDNGGEEFVLIPCLNDLDPWAKLIAQWGAEKLQD